MAGEQYDVEARIRVEKGGAQAAVSGLQSQVRGLTGATSSLGSGLTRVVGSAVAFGAAYFGVRAIAGGFVSLARNAGTFAGQLEVTRTSLGAILAATQPALSSVANVNERLNMAGEAGSAIFRQLEADSIKSVATGAELANIYSGIAGPILGAGAALSDVRQITNDTVAAATTLGVDFEQAQRDIMMMASGVAGTDVKLFRMLKSVGAITESTQEWNNMLPEDRIKRMGDALHTFAPSADRFGKTLPGAISTFTGLVQVFRQAFAGPTIDRFSGFLSNLNATLIENQDRIMAFFSVVGARMGAIFGRMFDRISAVTSYLINNMESVIERLGAKFEALREMLAPILGAVGGITPGKLLAGAAGSKVIGMAGGPRGIVSAIVDLGNKIGLGQGRNALGQFTQNRVAGGIGGLAVMGVIAGTVGFMADVWGSLVSVFDAFLPLLGFAWQGISDLATGLMSFLMPAFKLIGAVVTGVLVAAFAGLSGMLALFSPVLSGIGALFRWAGEQLEISLNWITEGFKSLIADIVSGLEILGISKGAPNTARTPRKTEISGFDQFLLDMKTALGVRQEQKEKDKETLAKLEGAPTTRKQTVNDFRGSTINVKQDFREADPDRVWIQLLDGINAAADRRLASALVPDFTR